MSGFHAQLRTVLARLGAVLAARRAGRHERIAAAHPIPDELWEWCARSHRIFRRLDEADLARLRTLAAAFLAEKKFVPVGGAALDDETRLSVAAQACLPLLGLDLDWYSDWTTIYITPREYEVKNSRVDEAGVVHEFDDEFAGEAFDLGPVALSRVDIEEAGWGDGYNVIIHEMAHKLDGRNGAYDGSPPLHPGMDADLWRRSFSDAYENLRARLEAGGRGGRKAGARKKGGRGPGRGARRVPRIDPYAAESPDEFFAVCCEYFFENPSVLVSEYPEVHARLVEFFRRGE